MLANERWDNMRDGYAAAVKKVLRYGARTAPRDLATVEVSPFHLELTKPWDAVASGVRRQLVPAIGYAEGLQLVGECSNPDLMVKIAPNFERFRGADGQFHGAYGLRLSTTKVVRLLAREPDSRQAVLSIYDDTEDLYPSADDRPVDVPCTIALHFMLRDEKLDLHAYMRSNDVWWGLPYDVMQFTMLQLSVANALNVGYGTYHHHATSLHLYERDRERATSVQFIGTVDLHEVQQQRYGWATGVGRKGQAWEEIRERARRLLEGRRVDKPTEYEALLCTAMARYA